MVDIAPLSAPDRPAPLRAPLSPLSRTVYRARQRFRRRRFAIFERILEAHIAAAGGRRIRILDVGGVSGYWRMLEERFRDKVEVVVLTPGDPNAFEPAPGLPVEVTVGDGCAMSMVADRQFDICHSNSVLEHVGSLQRMMAFAAEVRRVAVAYYVQTPYLWFPVEPHFNLPLVGWLPPSTRAQLVWRTKLGKKRFASYAETAAFVDHCQMVDAYTLRQLFPEAELHRERLALMTKSVTAVYNPVG